MQQYEGQICRPPMERASYMLGIAAGCAYNRCAFCTLFKHLESRELSILEITAELSRVRALGANPKTVFLGDGNAFGTDTGRLLQILALVQEYFPACERVNMDATVTDISRKSDEDLRLLREAGVHTLYLGIESGLDDVLLFMRKDHIAAGAEAQIARIHAVGMEYGAHIMTGVAGAGRGEENARALAAFLNRTSPVRIINFSLMLHSSAPLYREVQAGRFRPADELENLLEERLLLESLNIPCQYDGFHDCIEVRVRGNLPEDRTKMLEALAAAIARWSAEPAVFSHIDDVPWLTELQQRKLR